MTLSTKYYQARKLLNERKKLTKGGGFTLIELMIVVAVIAIILTLAIPTYSNYTIRMKVAESLSVSSAAKTAVTAACQEDLTINPITSSLAGYTFEPSTYVANVVLGGPCTTPTITITTQNTGVQPDPVLTITGDLAEGAGHTSWKCVSSGLNIHLPDTCRS